MYLPYSEYQAMGGALSELVFSDYENRAEAIINYRIFNRLENEEVIPDKVKFLVKQIIDLVEKKSLSMSLGKSGTSSNIYITSQSNDGVSTSYSGMASSDLFMLCDKEIQERISISLSGVKNSKGQKLLYRGLYQGE